MGIAFSFHVGEFGTRGQPNNGVCQYHCFERNLLTKPGRARRARGKEGDGDNAFAALLLSHTNHFTPTNSETPSKTSVKRVILG